MSEQGAPARFLDRGRVAEFWNEARRAADAEQQTGYLQDEWPAALGHDRLRGEWAQVERWLARHGGPRRACLDVGCGSGAWLERLAPHFAVAHGIDLSSEMVASAKARLARAGLGNTEVRCQSALELDGAQRYDLIFVGGVLMYLNDDELDGMMARLAGLLAPGGLLVLRESTCAERTWYRDTPLSPGLFASRPQPGLPPPARPPYYAIYRTPDVYPALARRHGLTVQRCEPNRHYKLADLTETALRVLDYLTRGRLARDRAAAERAARWIYRLRAVTLAPAYYLVRTLAPRLWRLDNQWVVCAAAPPAG